MENDKTVIEDGTTQEGTEYIYEDTFQYADSDNDITLLKVLGRNNVGEDRKAYIKKLSVAILKVVSKHGIAKLRAVGSSAVHNAQSAIAIAEYRSAICGKKLVEETRFTGVQFGEEMKPAIMKNVFYME